MNEICELVHSLDSDSAARRLTVPALLEVNLSGEATKSGVAPEDVGAGVERYPSIRGLMTMPPLADDPEASRPWFRAPRGARGRARARRSSRWAPRRTGEVAVEEGATLIRVGSSLVR